MSDTRTEIPPDMPLSVTLPAQQWFRLQELLGEFPYKVSAPYIGEIQRQCVAQAARQPEPEYMPRRSNGGVAGAGVAP